MIRTTAPPDLDALRELTERYARYSRSAGGLGLVIGGVLVAAAFAAGAWLPLTPWLRTVLATLPLVWLLAKELLRVGYYQRIGTVTQQISPVLRRKRRWMGIYLGAISALVIGGWLLLASRSGIAVLLQGPTLGYLAVVAALPFVAMRWFWSTGDFLVGVLLCCQAAVVVAGGNYDGWWPLYAAGCAAYAIGMGLHEHRNFLAIRATLRAAA